MLRQWDETTRPVSRYDHCPGLSATDRSRSAERNSGLGDVGGTSSGPHWDASRCRVAPALQDVAASALAGVDAGDVAVTVALTVIAGQDRVGPDLARHRRGVDPGVGRPRVVSRTSPGKVVPAGKNSLYQPVVPDGSLEPSAVAGTPLADGAPELA